MAAASNGAGKSAKDKTVSIEDLLNEVSSFVATVKRIHRLVYQLAFVITSDGPGKEEAIQYIERLIEAGLVSPRFYQKALNDVKRWRKYRYRLFDNAELEYEKHSGDGDSELGYDGP